MVINGSKFYNLNSTKGGAVYIEQIEASKTGETLNKIENCEFVNNTAYQGGAL